LPVVAAPEPNQKCGPPVSTSRTTKSPALAACWRTTPAALMARRHQRRFNDRPAPLSAASILPPLSPTTIRLASLSRRGISTCRPKLHGRQWFARHSRWHRV